MSSSCDERLSDSTVTSESTGGGSWRGSCSGRVRDLARRFEQPTTNVHIRNLSSFSKTSRRRLYQANEKGERSTPWPPQKPARLRLGLYRKRSSMKKRSRSHLDVPSEIGNSKLATESSCSSMRKSRSNNEDISDYIRLQLNPTESQSDRPLSPGEIQKIVCMQLRENHEDPANPSQQNSQSAAVSETVNRDEAVSGCGTPEQFRRPDLRLTQPTPGVKPIPPAKPARFKKKSLLSDPSSSPTASSVRTAVPPPVLPKTIACLRIMEEVAQRYKKEDNLDCPRTSSEEIVLDGAITEPEDRDVFGGEEEPECEVTATTSSCACIDEIPIISVSAERSEDSEKNVSFGELRKCTYPTGTCTLPRSREPGKGILRRSTYLNEDIKKPTIQPPPPPLPAISSRVRCAGAIQKQHSFRITHSSDEVTHIEVPSSSQFDCLQYRDQWRQSLQDSNQTQTYTSTEKKITEFPRVPSIPPPVPPKISPQGSLDDDEMYEEIEHVISFPETGGSDCEDRKSLDNRSDKASPYATGLCIANCSSKEETSSESHYGYASSVLNHHFIKALKFNDDTKVGKKKHSFRTLRLRRRSSNSKRPMSSLEFDKLLRIKSDIQLNISRKVGQIKLKVTSSSQDKERKEKGNSTFYVNPEELKAEINFPLDDNYIYGDDWSTDEEDFVSADNPDGNIIEDDFYKTTNGVSSMLSEIEEELKLKISSTALPDLVPKEDTRNEIVPDAQLEENEVDALEQPGKSEEAKNEEKQNLNDPEKLKPTLDGYQQIESPSSSTSDKAFDLLQNSHSDSALNNSQHSLYTPRFLPEPQPLYQIYMLEQQEGLLYNGHDNDEGVMLINESVEKEIKVRRTSSSASTDSGRGADCSTTVSHITSNTSMRRDRLVAASHFGSQRSLWCELPEVKNAGLLDVLDEDMKKLQEAFFEVITSEASYLRSLNILITHFMAAPELLGSKGTSSVITNEERKQLFSNIFAVRDCSERLLCDLESRLEANLVLTDVCDILSEHFSKNFEPYVMYCSNQVYQDRTLKRLKCENASFMSCIQRLESDRQCQGLDMRSFLMLPMQRVTRYPLLVIAILDRIANDTEQQKNAQSALHLANQVVINCNEGARRMERTEQLLEIERRLVYKSSDLRRIPLVSSGRYLVKRGSLMHLTENKPKTILQSRQHSRNLYLFLFSDILMISKKKLNGTFVCKDYAARKFVDIEPVEADNPKVSPAALTNLACKPHLFICTLMHNARGRQAELLLNADSESDRERWLSALRPPTCSNPEEKIYADWDCPQATVVHNYAAGQEDELPLEKGDLINILRKMPDGWFYGERVNDGKGGWFPSSYVQQVLNDHVRAKNYRQRLRVIQAAAGYRHQKEQQKTSDSSVRKTPHFIDRFRRLSNPKGFFHTSRSVD